VGLQGRKIDLAQLPPNNLVFLADVSGSMNSPRKLPLLKASLRLLVNNLRPEDRVALIVYAGAAGLVLDSTPGTDRQKILEAIDNLNAGGSTAGGAGIKLAYQVAKENFMPKGNNRIILATDGDFNVGQSSDADLTRLVEEKRDGGVYLTVLGLGKGNYKDSKMEKLADKGNGNYAYVDNIREAKKALVTEVGGTLFTIAKDVKLQIEFNPATVSSYRLIGYENRMLKAEDFNNDKKDAGELGAGHRVTALYEIVRVGTEEPVAKVDKLKYQKKVKLTKSKDLLTLKLRYKASHETESQLITQIVKTEDITSDEPSNNWAFASAVAEFALLVRDSEHKGSASFEATLERARKARGKDEHGYRAEFAQLVESADILARR
jgi:Ca-activated chloride channel family protein